MKRKKCTCPNCQADHGPLKTTIGLTEDRAMCLLHFSKPVAFVGFNRRDLQNLIEALQLQLQDMTGDN